MLDGTTSAQRHMHEHITKDAKMQTKARKPNKRAQRKHKKD